MIYGIYFLYFCSIYEANGDYLLDNKRKEKWVHYAEAIVKKTQDSVEV